MFSVLYAVLNADEDILFRPVVTETPEYEPLLGFTAPSGKLFPYTVSQHNWTVTDFI